MFVKNYTVFGGKKVYSKKTLDFFQMKKLIINFWSI